AACPARDVHCAPGPAAADERTSELERNAARSEQVPITGAARGPPARRVAEDPDGLPPAGEGRERVDVLDQVLARDDQLAGGRDALGGEDAVVDQLLRRVARQ